MHQSSSIKKVTAMKQKAYFPQAFPRGKVAYFATSNIHKFQEACLILSKYRIATAKLKIEVIEIQNDNLEKIARASVQDAVEKCGLPLFVEDAGLFIAALNSYPGPYSKYVYKTIGLEGVLKLMKNVENREAFFKSVIAFGSPKGKPVSFVGKVDGKLSLKKRGTYGFGYDPIFIPVDGNGRTFAEMDITQKNKYSHRSKALTKFAEWYSNC